MNGRGQPFVQLYQRLPLGKYLYLPFEINYDTHPGTEFARTHWVVPVGAVLFYMAAIYLGTKYMATRPRMDLRYKLAYWNALLSLFSFVGALRTVPDLMYRLGTEDLSASLCTEAGRSWGAGATGLWVQLFIFSKLPELVDTYFIVARQRPLIFLHYYHHITVLLYCWHSYATEATQALYFVAMNYSVHAIMYGYYCLVALKIPAPWLPPAFITGVQIAQMVVGTGVQVAASYKYLTGAPNCGVNGANVFWGGLMYLSYFGLFAHFAVARYLKPKAAKGAKTLHVE
jgi:hypothetical protein